MKRILSTIVAALAAVSFAAIVSAADMPASTDQNVGATSDQAQTAPKTETKKPAKKSHKKAKKHHKKAKKSMKKESAPAANEGAAGATGTPSGGTSGGTTTPGGGPSGK